MKAVVRTSALLNRNHWRSFATTSARRIDASSPAAFTVTESAGTVNTVSPPNLKEGWLYIDSVFPIRIGMWDIRSWIGILREDHLTQAIRSMLSNTGVPNFNLVALEPQLKEGGLFVRYRYQDFDSEGTAASAIEEQLRTSLVDQGGIPSWANLDRSDVWAVKGTPWREDLQRFPTPVLKVSFDGPDIPEEQLWGLFRPFGRIVELSPPTSGSPGTLRSVNVLFRTMRSATIAKNVMHNHSFTMNGATTKLKTGYAQLIRAHVVRDWITGHPKIVLPIAVFLLGSLTYAIFDPIRVWMVQAKILNWFDWEEYSLFRWLKDNTPSLSSGTQGTLRLSNVAEVWKDRTEAQETIEKYLTEYPPCAITFIHGPQGSGKTALVTEALTSLGKRSLLLDCGPIMRLKDSDTKMVSALAQQTGYWPVFTFFNSMSNMIDLASVGLIGQKAGLSVSLTDQLKQILDVVGRSLGKVHEYHEKQVKDEAKREESLQQQRERLKKIQRGEWHDGRLDCVAGNGVMSELGIGDEKFGPDDSEAGVEGAETWDAATDAETKPNGDLDSMKGLPVVVIRGFEDSVGGKSELLDVVAQWATGLVDNKIAHVIVLSDNRENAKRLAKANHSRSLNTVALSDADADTALAFVQQKLKEAKLDIELTSNATASIGRLGGRASDLDNLIYKVRNGSTIADAMEDIIVRDVGELRKSALGDDAEDAKDLPWTRAQAWSLMKRLAREEEIPYHDTLMNFPFKGDEAALRNMEHAELITISTHNGRPSTIRPGKPVYKCVFERVVGDAVFGATQDIDYNKQLITASESTIKACEEELLRLSEIGEYTRSSVFGTDRAVSMRTRYLLNAMGEASAKIESLERANAKLKKLLVNH